MASKDERFQTHCSDDIIVQQGKRLLVQDGADLMSRNWLQLLDRNKLVSYSFRCFKRILCVLNINTSDCGYIHRIRRLENKRVNTTNSRKRKKTKEIVDLDHAKSSLESEKQSLTDEIVWYKVCSQACLQRRLS